jgi:cullin-5
VERLLELFNQFSLLVKEAFNDDPRYLTARDKAYKQVVNDTQVFRLELPSKQVIYILCTAVNKTWLLLSPSQNIVEILVQFFW